MTIRTYGAFGNLLSETWTLDKAGNQTVDVTNTVTYSYDDAGNLVMEFRTTDDNGDGIPNRISTMSYAYDEAGRVIHQVFTRDYNNDGNPDQITIESYSYDRLGNLLTSTYSNDSDGDGSQDYTVLEVYAYNDSNKLISRTYVIDNGGDGIPDHRESLVNTYDDYGNLIYSVEEWEWDNNSDGVNDAELLRTSSYDEYGNLKLVTISDDYDGDGHPNSIATMGYCPIPQPKPTLEERIAAASQSIEAMAEAEILNGGQTNSLKNKIEGFQKQLEKGNLAAACAKLQDMIDQLNNWMEEGVFDTEEKLAQAEALIVESQAIQDEIGCGASGLQLAVGASPEIKEHQLGQSYPNPVYSREEAYIPFVLHRESEVQLDLFDANGRLVARLAEGAWPAGEHQVRLRDVVRLRGGLYYYQLRTGSFRDVKKMMVVE